MKYNTKHRAEILACFTNSKHYSAKDIQSELRQAGHPIAMATIYRQLEALVTEKILLQSSVSGHSSCYELNPEFSCELNGVHMHYHARCERCGELYHISCSEIDELKVHLLKEHGFELDMQNFLLQGICEKCRKKVEMKEYMHENH